MAILKGILRYSQAKERQVPKLIVNLSFQISTILGSKKCNVFHGHGKKETTKCYVSVISESIATIYQNKDVLGETA